jgi:hypothetical protein
MQDAFPGSWATQPHFSTEKLGSLHELNHRFLDLVGARACEPAPVGALRLPGGASGRLAPLSAAQRAAAANCPYALFDLRFDDDAYWRTRLSGAGHWGVAEESDAEDDTVRFVRLALFYAWHVAATAKLAAQLLLGMNAHTAAAFRTVTFDCLPSLAGSEAKNLAARWSTSEPYWNALVGAAARPDALRLRRVQLFGLQLAAAAGLP